MKYTHGKAFRYPAGGSHIPQEKWDAIFGKKEDKGGDATPPKRQIYETPPKRQSCVKNAIRCLRCNDIIESTHVHDFKWCGCKNIAVDGGTYYLKRVGNLDEYEDLSEFEEI